MPVNVYAQVVGVHKPIHVYICIGPSTLGKPTILVTVPAVIYIIYKDVMFHKFDLYYICGIMCIVNIHHIMSMYYNILNDVW